MMQQELRLKPGLHPDPSGAGEPTGVESPVNSGKFSAMLRRRKWPALITFIVVLLLGSAYVFTRKPIYQSETTLELVTGGPDKTQASTDLLSAVSALTSSRNTDSQIEILQSPDLLNKIYNSFTPAEREAAFGKHTPDPTGVLLPSWSVAVVNKNETDVLAITAKAYNAKLAAETANRIAKEYLAEDLSRNSKATRQARIYIQNEIAKTSKELNAATRQLADFQRNHGLEAADAQTLALEQNVTTLQQQKQEASSALQEVLRQIASAQRQLSQTPSNISESYVVSENPEFAQVRQHLIDLNSQLSEISRTYRPGSATVQRLTGQIADEQARLRLLSKSLVTQEDRERNPLLDSVSSTYANLAISEAGTRAKLASATRDLAMAQKQLVALPEAQRTIGSLQESVKILQATYESLKDRYYELLIQERSGLPGGFVTSYAHPAEIKAAPKTSMNFLGALLLATLLAIAAARIAEVRDKTVYDLDFVDSQRIAPIVGIVPKVQSASVALWTQNEFFESFRLLRNNLVSSRDRKSNVFAVTSPGPKEGKTTIAYNLAIALGLDGYKVLLIDLDLQNPGIGKFLKNSSTVGFTELALGQASLDHALIPSGSENLDCIGAGAKPQNSAEFLNSKKSRSLISELQKNYDYLVLDCPSSADRSDMHFTSAIGAEILLIVAENRTRRNQLLSSVNLYRLGNAPLLGIVYNFVVKASKSSLYGS